MGTASICGAISQKTQRKNKVNEKLKKKFKTQRESMDDILRYPKMVAIEVTNHCPMKCIHCPHGHSKIKNKGMMSEKLFQDIVDDVASWKDSAPEIPELVLYGNGEPLLHKKIVEFVRYCAEKGIRPNLSTNIMMTTPELGEELSKAGLKLIKLSFWGDSAQEYESRTKKQSFQKAIEKAKSFIENTISTTEIVINIVKFRKGVY